CHLTRHLASEGRTKAPNVPATGQSLACFAPSHSACRPCALGRAAFHTTLKTRTTTCGDRSDGLLRRSVRWPISTKIPRHSSVWSAILELAPALRSTVARQRAGYLM